MVNSVVARLNLITRHDSEKDYVSGHVVICFVREMLSGKSPYMNDIENITLKSFLMKESDF